MVTRGQLGLGARHGIQKLTTHSDPTGFLTWELKMIAGSLSHSGGLAPLGSSGGSRLSHMFVQQLG